MVTAQDIIKKALTQAGDKYIFGAETNLRDPNPQAFDCSELVQWVCAQCGVNPSMPDGAEIQRKFCVQQKTLIPVDQGIRTMGALLFRAYHHVAFSLGNGKTFEAMGHAWPVGSYNAYGRGWTHAALIPGVIYGANTPVQGGTTANPPTINISLGTLASEVNVVAHQVWKLGSSGKGVKIIQILLCSYGFIVAQDGIFGLQTTAAVKRFQQMKKLSADGVVGPATWASLLH